MRNARPQCLVESLRVSPVKQVARELAQELKSYHFGLQESFCKPQYLKLSSNVLLENQPPIWNEFYSCFFKGNDISQAKTDVVFQILHYLMTGGKEPTPFYIQIITTNDNRVPIPPVLKATSLLNGAMDNFDRNENTLAGTASTHDIILVLLQNVPLQLQKPLSKGQISTWLPSLPS